MRRDDVFIEARELIGRVPAVDLHIHTRYSDGNSTVEEYIRSAKMQGLETICFTDHADFTTTWLDRCRADIADYGKKCKNLEVLEGMEVRARDRSGELNARDEMLDGAELVVGVVHSIPSEDGLHKLDPRQFSGAELLSLEYELSLRLLCNKRVSVLGHPMSNYEKLHGRVPDRYYKNILRKARDAGKAVEISARYKNDFNGYLRLCLEYNPLVSLGSDAHSISELGAVCAKLKEVL